MAVMGSSHAERRHRYRRRPMTSLSRCPLIFKLVLALTLLVVPTSAQNSDEISVGSFIDDETLDACKSSLEEADADGDGEVGAKEYINYVKGETAGIVSETTFADIPLPLVMLFIRYACKCTFEPNPSPDCCQGSNAHLNIEDDGSPERLVYLIDFCLDAVDAVTEVKESASVAPTAAPTVEGQMSVKLQYKLTNEDDLDADAVLNEIENTLKSDLVAATRTIVIKTLDEMLAKPRASFSPEHLMRSRSKIFKHSSGRAYESWNGDSRRLIAGGSERIDKDGQAGRISALSVDTIQGGYRYPTSVETDVTGSEHEWDDERRRQETILRIYHRARRRLVIYTDELPVEIYQVIDNPDCLQGLTCLLIFTRIRLILEEGDDPVDVRKAIIGGMRQAFQDGSFLDAIPDEGRRLVAIT